MSVPVGFRGCPGRIVYKCSGPPRTVSSVLSGCQTLLTIDVAAPCRAGNIVIDRPASISCIVCAGRTRIPWCRNHVQDRVVNIPAAQESGQMHLLRGSVYVSFRQLVPADTCLSRSGHVLVSTGTALACNPPPPVVFSRDVGPPLLR